LAAERQSVGRAEEFPQVHAGGKGIPRPGEHQHTAAVVDLERIEDADHLIVERRAHAVALFRPVQGHPGNLVLELHQDVLAPRFLA
jgi:hypothetical protein